MLAKFIIFVVLPMVVYGGTELPHWHLKPLGSHRKADPVDEYSPDNMVSPEDFAKNYVLPRKPVVFRDVVKAWPAYKLWSDAYLTEMYGEMELRLEAKKEKSGNMPKGDVCLGRDRMKTFIKEYREGADKYVVSDLPAAMYKEVHVPPAMACGDFLKQFVEIDLWMNSDLGKKGNGGNSIIHKDAFNTVNCVVNGTKEWKLVELQYNDLMYQSWEGPMDAGYGGYSLVNPDKVDAKEYPDVGKIPRWQFTTINAGDCIYLPSQMWHQVKSFGETNRAIAFLFSFKDKQTVDTTGCEGANLTLPLSDVDVAWPYAGSGLMPMGYSELEDYSEMLMELVSRKKGYVTKKSTYRAVYGGHSSGAVNKKMILEKTKKLYKHLLDIAGGVKEKMTADFIANLTRDQIRFTPPLLNPVEPANGYEHELSVYLPEELTSLVEQGKGQNGGVLTKQFFMKSYLALGGTESFGLKFWERLAGEKDSIKDTSATLAAALEPYEYYRRNSADGDDSDDDSTITTPQGHKSQPKKKKGGYARNEEEDERRRQKEEEGREREEGREEREEGREERDERKDEL